MHTAHLDSDFLRSKGIITDKFLDLMLWRWFGLWTLMPTLHNAIGKLGKLGMGIVPGSGLLREGNGMHKLLGFEGASM